MVWSISRASGVAKTILQALWHGQDNVAGPMAWPRQFCRVSGMANTFLQGLWHGQHNSAWGSTRNMKERNVRMCATRVD